MRIWKKKYLFVVYKPEFIYSMIEQRLKNGGIVSKIEGKNLYWVLNMPSAVINVSLLDKGLHEQCG